MSKTTNRAMLAVHYSPEEQRDRLEAAKTYINAALTIIKETRRHEMLCPLTLTGATELKRLQDAAEEIQGIIEDYHMVSIAAQSIVG